MLERQVILLLHLQYRDYQHSFYPRSLDEESSPSVNLHRREQVDRKFQHLSSSFLLGLFLYVG